MSKGAPRAIAWTHGVVSMEPLGGMLGPTAFVLADGRQIAPFQVAPWAGEPGSEALPGILQRLRGEWPCVPFGSDSDRAAAGGWPASAAVASVDLDPHGYGANHEWTFVDAGDGAIALTIGYPGDHPIERLVRTITPDPNAPAIDIDLTILARRDCALPIGLHPVFRLPEAPGAMRIEIDNASDAMTYPGDVDASSIFAAGQYATDWRSIALRDGTRLDPSRLPLRYNTEELLQLLSPSGQVALWNSAEGYRVRLLWNCTDFPSLMFWFSNRGRQMPPWSGRHLALGVEPVCSAFDLGPQVSAAANPINARGVPTVHRFTAGVPFATRYRIEVEPAP